MSYHFYIKKNQPVTYQSVLDEISRNDVRIAYAEEYDLDEEFSDSAKFYIPGFSSRGISVSEDEGTFDICINILASGEDYLLSCQLALAIARITGSDIDPEAEEGPLDVATFAQQFNADWVETSKTMGLSAVIHMVKENSDTVNFSGCLRSYFFGPDLLGQFTQDNPDEQVLYDRVMQSVRNLQYLPETIRIPGVYVVTPQNGEKWEYIVLMPEQEQFLLKTDYVIFYIDEENRHKIPFEAVEAYAKTRFTRLDEKQYIFPELSLGEFTKMIETLIPKEEEQEAPKKKWWQFGKN